MSDLLQATYADLKTVKTRSVCQVVLEMPIEALTDVVRLLGAPVPGNEVWVAVARLNLSAAPTEPVQIAHDNDDPPYKPRPLSQIAAMLCTKPTFKRFIYEGSEGWDHVPTTEEAADWVRSVCQIGSRKELDTIPEAAERFRKIRAEHDAWLVA